MNARTDSILADLNEPQRQAVTHRDGPLLVLAGAGSGKTRVITRRAAHLVNTGVPSGSILALTFTNKAAGEMKQRIEAMGVARGMWVYTFHALGVRLLREFGPLARIEPGFTIYDETDRLRLVKDAMETCKVSDVLVPPRAVQAAISNAKNALQTPSVFRAAASTLDEQRLAPIYEAYEKLLEQHNAVDFDDLLMRVAIVLRDHPDITERLNVRFRYVLIDEYQDTNHAQYLIAGQLSRHHDNICATGDPDQSIYGWRGADLGNILEFERDHSDAVVVRLEQNYRSTGNILRVASALISANHRRKAKKLWTRGGDGCPVHVWKFREGEDEAVRIAGAIREMRDAGRVFSDFAIMYRVNAVSRGLEEALRDRRIPYKIARGLEFYNRKEIRDVVAYLRVLVNPADQISLLRIINTPPRGIGKTTVQRLVAAAAERGRPLFEIICRAGEFPKLGPAVKKLAAFIDLIESMKGLLAGSVAKAVDHVLKASGLEEALRRERDEGGDDRLANVAELVTAATRFEKETEEPTLADFLHRVSLTSDQDQVDESAGYVILLTLHASKGLEFPVVFIVGLEQGLLPHERSIGEGNVEEERRLCFVGITRAKERLTLSHADWRVLRGSTVPRSRSQFLMELDPDATHWEDFSPPAHRSASAANEKSDEDGFVPLDDHLPPDETPPLRRKPRSTTRSSFGFGADLEARIVREAARGSSQASDSRYADWAPGTLVQHDEYGAGQIMWIRPGGGQTRAAIRFAGYGEKTFILERSTVEKLERNSAPASRRSLPRSD